MHLVDLIEFLEKVKDKSRRVVLGFSNAHSYRGYYDELAFEPCPDVTVQSMLDDAKSALNATFQGWKGGQYLMTEYTNVWLANKGETGEGIGEVLLNFMLNAGPLPAISDPKIDVIYESMHQDDDGHSRSDGIFFADKSSAARYSILRHSGGYPDDPDARYAIRKNDGTYLLLASNKPVSLENSGTVKENFLKETLKKLSDEERELLEEYFVTPSK